MFIEVNIRRGNRTNGWKYKNKCVPLRCIDEFSPLFRDHTEILLGGKTIYIKEKYEDFKDRIMDLTKLEPTSE